MELSALMARLQSKGVEVSLRPNFKKYYNRFPQVIRLNDRINQGNSRNGYLIHQHLSKRVYEDLNKKLTKEDFRSRHEYYELVIFCYDAKKVLSSIKMDTLKEFNTITIGIMEDKVFEESKTKVDLPRAQTVVVKKLPHKGYRYRVFWPKSGKFRKIGKDALGAIVDQINNDPHTRPLSGVATDYLKRGSYYGGTYFYTNSEDLFSIISLIDSRFIAKIEKFTTIEELNEKTAS